jgi:DHA1 family bicyclomycin/chloramphenicol resistance-like MFS transporter
VTATDRDTARSPVRSSGTGLLALLGALVGLTPFAVDAYLPALPAITRDFGTSSSATQLTLAALMVGLAAGQLAAGPLSDRFGRRRPVLIGLVGFVLASLGCAVAPTVEALIALRLVQGLTGSAAVVVARAVVRDEYDGAAAARAFARLILVMGAAPVLAPVVGAQVLRLTSWRGIFALLAALGAVLLLLAARRLPETLPPERRSAGGLRPALRTYRLLLRDRGFLWPALASGASFAAMFAYIAGSPYVLQEVHGLSATAFSLVFAVNAGTFVLLSQVSARVVERTGPARLVVAGSVLGVVGSAVLLVSVLAGVALPGILPGLLLVVGAVGLVAPNSTALALAEHKRVAGSASALLGVLQFLLAAVAAPLTGLGGSASDLPMTVVITGSALLSLALGLAAARRAPALTG